MVDSPPPTEICEERYGRALVDSNIDGWKNMFGHGYITQFLW